MNKKLMFLLVFSNLSVFSSLDFDIEDFDIERLMANPVFASVNSPFIKTPLKVSKKSINPFEGFEYISDKMKTSLAVAEGLALMNEAVDSLMDAITSNGPEINRFFQEIHAEVLSLARKDLVSNYQKIKNLNNRSIQSRQQDNYSRNADEDSKTYRRKKLSRVEDAIIFAQSNNQGNINLSQTATPLLFRQESASPSPLPETGVINKNEYFPKSEDLATIRASLSCDHTSNSPFVTYTNTNTKMMVSVPSFPCFQQIENNVNNVQGKK